ncbi:hypothetical protein B0A72_02925 [Flavobacterium pectinovorum]|uniref:RND family efflux transporter, MFP subunit n=1 Tax=Flavobacterium pectinovorum TaxID=29533 RepID=A0AB36P6I3_9FLAO|nr:hypothetical protein B0A72_02925 [Flavobacterium pectinovorum]
MPAYSSNLETYSYFMKSFKFFLAALALAFSTQSCKKAETQQKQKPVKVSYVEISEVEREQELRYSATIEADNTAQIGFAVSGIVNAVLAEEGQYVKHGQLLASLDATTFSNSFKIANSSYAQTLDLYDRQNQLYKKGSLPVSEYISIKAKLEQSEANKKISAKNLADCRLNSPMSGIITIKSIERGSTAGPGVAAFTIIKTDQVYAVISVPEVEVGTLRPGMDVSIYVPTLDENLKGKINIINPQADQTSKTYMVKAKINNSNQKLLPGMLAEVAVFPKKNKKVIVIPASSVARDADNFTYVYVINNQNKAVRKRITVGKITGKQDLIVEQGINSGDKVVVSGVTRLKDGAEVTF